MSSIKDLLKTPANFKAPPRFPAGNYIMVITSYDMLPFSWKKSGTHGLAYAPSIKPLSCIEADDDDNPDLQKEQLEALKTFGDWTSKVFQFAYNSRENNAKMAQVSEVNFPLIETDADHQEALGILEKHAWRFYMREDDGTERGFVVDTLGLSFPPDTDLGDILEATVNKKFLCSLIYEPNANDPSRPPNLAVESVTSI
jgi:hypothetical protein